MRFRPIFLTLALALLIHGTAFADGGNIMGDVYLDNQAASGLCVDVFDSGSNVVASQLTGGDGDYNVYVASPGGYTVRFSDCGQGYVTTQWYSYASKQEDASAVQVVSDQITPNVNGYVVSAGRVTGHLKDDLNAVLTGACVKAEDYTGSIVAETTTDGNGDYVLGGVVPGQTKIHFEGCSAGNFVPGSATVGVDAGVTTSGVNAVLPRAGEIAGHVQNADAEPLQNMCVGGWGDGADLSTAITDSNGNYQISGVPPTGGYQLSVWDCYGSSNYMSIQKTGPLAGTGTATVNFTMPRAAYITGHVRDEAGTGLASICVQAKDPVAGLESSARTDRNGYYELNQLYPGTYDLTFNVDVGPGEEGCDANGGFATATTAAVVLGDGVTLMDVDKTLKHVDPAPPADPGSGGSGGEAGSGGQPSGPGPGGSVAEASGPGTPAGGTPEVHPPVARCKVPGLVGLTLAKARKSLAKAGCRIGRVTRKAGRRHGRVLRQKAERGASKPAGFRVALTVAK